MTPEMVNCLAKVNRILTVVSQQRYSLLELYEERHRSLSQSYSLKQFDLGLTKVRNILTLLRYNEQFCFSLLCLSVFLFCFSDIRSYIGLNPKVCRRYVV